MKIHLISWNVEGITDIGERRVIKAFLCINKTYLIYIQVTKIQGMTKGIIGSLGVGRKDERWVVRELM